MTRATRTCTSVLAAGLLLIPGVPVSASEDADVLDRVTQIFGGEISLEHANVVLDDEPRKLFWAFHLAKYLDVIELRVYRVPYDSSDPQAIRALLDAGDDDGAFSNVLANMNLSMGAQYVSDVGLDGIKDEAVPLGEGSLRDNFHREQFSSHAEADTVYRQWLERATTLVVRAS